MNDYALTLSEAEVRRYRLMAERAGIEEAGHWRSAGIGPGAVVADVGCGPAAVAVVIAGLVEPAGRVIGVEPGDGVRAAAEHLVAEAGATNVELRPGTGTASGIPPGSVDVVMMRHVLAHDGREEQAIVDHLASLVRPGGSVYLVDTDGSAVRTLDGDPELEDLAAKYLELHRRRGNDLRAGLRLGQLLARAGLDVVLHEGRYSISSVPPGVRPPSWAARDAMLAQGIASADDARRWEAAFERSDSAPARPTIFVPTFIAIGTSR